MVTKANSGAPVIDLIAAQDIAEMLSSLPPVGDRDPGVMGAAVAVVGETVVVTISNSVTSGANPLIVTVSVNAWGRRVERSIFALYSEKNAWPPSASGLSQDRKSVREGQRGTIR